MAYHEQDMHNEAGSVKSAVHALSRINAILTRLREAQNVLGSTTSRTQALKSLAVETSRDDGT